MTDPEDHHKVPAWALRIFGATALVLLSASVGWLAHDRNQAWERIHSDAHRITALEASITWQSRQLTEIRDDTREMRTQIVQLTAAVARLNAE